MKIVRVDLLHLNLKLKRPFETSFFRLTEKETVLVRAYSADGLIGYGEGCAMPLPYYNEESTSTVWLMLQELLVPGILGKQLHSIDDVEATYAPVRRHSIAKSALEAAFWHIRAQEAGEPLWKLWGGVRDRIETGISIGAEPTVAQVAAKVGTALEAGYRRIKVKIKPGSDVEVAHGLRQEFGSISLMLDANSAYTLQDIGLLHQLDQFDLLMLEQPLEHDDIIDHATLQSQISTPVCLDESIHTRSDARKAIALGSARIINIKPPRVGGFWQAKLMAEDCQSRGIPVWCGGMIETGLGKAFNIHISSLANFTLPGDTSGTDQYFEEDILTDPIVVDRADSCIPVPTGPGLGFNVDERAVSRLCVKSACLTA
jgi:O-succinylbenzoate synthase